MQMLELQIQRQIQPNRAQIRGQIPPNTRGEPTNTPDTRPDTPDTATFSIWPLVVSICVSAVAYFTEKQARTRTTARPRAEDYKAQRRGQAQRRRGVWGLGFSSTACPFLRAACLAAALAEASTGCGKSASATAPVSTGSPSFVSTTSQTPPRATSSYF